MSARALCENFEKAAPRWPGEHQQMTSDGDKVWLELRKERQLTSKLWLLIRKWKKEAAQEDVFCVVFDCPPPPP